MANTKTRHKNKRNKNEKSTGKRKKMRLKEVEDLKFLSPDDKIQYLLKNGHLIKNEVFNDASLKKGTLLMEAIVRKPQGRNNELLAKNGRLENVNEHIKYMDSILMSELLIKKTPRRTDKKKQANGNNNNDNDLSDQNNSDTEIRDEGENNKNASETQNNNIIEVTIDTNDPVISTDRNQTRGDNEVNKTNAKQTPKKSEKRGSDIEIIEICFDTKNPIISAIVNQTSTNKTKKAKRKDSRLEQRQMKTVKLSNGHLISLTSFQCDHCESQFCSKSSLQRHMLLHLNLKPYTCQHCPRQFRQQGNWRAHIARAHPSENRYNCKLCTKTFALCEELKLHKKEHLNEKKHRYTCVFCDKKFQDEKALAEHEKQHMSPGRYKCKMCPMSYDSRLIYSHHLKTHTKVEDFSCQYCGKSYLRPSSIARHIRVSHGGMRMQCPVCHKLLKGHLTEHMRTHENQRPHECDTCGQRFTQSTQLTVHKRSHTGVRPYLCRICKQPFSHSNALMLHIRRHTGEKPFACAMCPQTFSQLPHMKAHMRSIHSKTEFYKCNNCNTFFKLKALLEAHAAECGDAQSPKTPKDEEAMLVSKMRFHLALLFTMIAKEKLHDLGFNKRLIDDILVDSIEAMGMQPCKDKELTAFSRLKINSLMLLQGTIPKHQMALFAKERKTTEEILELLTDDLNK